MATQYKDGSFSGIEPFPEAVETFNKALESGIAKAFFVGTEAEVTESMRLQKLNARIEALEERASKEDSPIAIPDDEFIRRFSKARGVTQEGE